MNDFVRLKFIVVIFNALVNCDCFILLTRTEQYDRKHNAMRYILSRRGAKHLYIIMHSYKPYLFLKTINFNSYHTNS